MTRYLGWLLVLVYVLAWLVRPIEAARNFGNVSTDHLANTTAPISKYAQTGAFSFVFWANVTGTGAFKYYVSYDDVGPGDHAGWAAYLDGSQRPVCYVSSGAGTLRGAGGNASTTNGAWFMWGCTYDGSGTVTRWQSGQKDPSVTTTAITPTYGGNRGLVFGMYPDLSFCGCANAQIADFAFWNVALTDDEWRSMAGTQSNSVINNLPGVHPTCVEPKSLQAYIPLAGIGTTEPDFSPTSLDLTVTGTTVTTSNPPLGAPCNKAG